MAGGVFRNGMKRVGGGAIFYESVNIECMESMTTSTQEKSIQPPIFTFEKVGDISTEQEAQVQEVCDRAADSLAEEYQTREPISVNVCIMSDEKFREGAKENDPASWKFCFLLRDQGGDLKDGSKNKVYISVDIFDVLPNDADRMIKHEIAHLVVANLVGNFDAYKQSFLLEEGTAGLDGATETLISKIKRENIKDIPDPLSIKNISDAKSIGGDTNVEPFTEQFGDLIMMSFVEFLKQKHGAEKIVKVYRKLNDKTSLQEAYKEICGNDLGEVAEEWKNQCKNAII